jgi:uncharacterized protein YjiS (DUF1127 family)
VWNLTRPRETEAAANAERKRAILRQMNLAELADIGIKPADIARLERTMAR